MLDLKRGDLVGFEDGIGIQDIICVVSRIGGGESGVVISVPQVTFSAATGHAVEMPWENRYGGGAPP